jgi:secreted trypsin-like serine protease
MVRISARHGNSDAYTGDSGGPALHNGEVLPKQICTRQNHKSQFLAALF